MQKLPEWLNPACWLPMTESDKKAEIHAAILSENPGERELALMLSPAAEAFLELMADWNVAHDVLRELLPEEEAKLVSEDLSLETIDGWSVLRLGIKRKESAIENGGEDREVEGPAETSAIQQ